MLWGFVNLLIWGSVLLYCRRKINLSDIKNKRRAHFISIVVVLVLWTVIGSLPVEELFVTFASPEDAFRAYSDSDVPVFMTIEGEDSALVIGEEAEHEYTLKVVNRAEDGWKTGSGFNFKTRHFSDQNKNATITVYQHKQNDDIFIEVLIFDKEDCTVLDNRQSEFVVIEDETEVDGEKYVFCSYYAYAGKYDKGYSLTIDGTEYYLFEKDK